MRKQIRFTCVFAFLVLTSCGSSDDMVQDDGTDDGTDDIPTNTAPRTETFTVEALSSEMASESKDIFTFLDKDVMSVTMYLLDRNTMDARTTVSQDEVYFIYEGEADIIIDEQANPVKSGYSIFIPGGQPRSLVNVTQDLKVIITTLKQKSVGTSSPHRLFSDAQVEAGRNPNSNVWNPFLNESSVIFGLYMLPQTVNGDGRLVHGWDELNIISQGNCTFRTDDAQITVKKGSIVFVKEGNGHFFRNLNSDTDIFILWDQ